jgi:hypothetical protein
MQAIQPGGCSKLRRTERGKQSSLSDLLGANIAERLLKSSVTEVKTESPEAITHILKEVAANSSVLTTEQLDTILLLMVEVVEGSFKLIEELESFATRINRSLTLSPAVNQKADELFLSNKIQYFALLKSGEGTGVSALYRAILSGDNVKVQTLLNRKIDFSLIEPKISSFVRKGFKLLDAATFSLLINKLDPSLENIEKWILKEKNFNKYFKIVQKLIDQKQLSLSDIQKLYDFASDNSAAPWMAFFALRGAKSKDNGCAHCLTKIIPTSDLSVAILFKFDSSSEHYCNEMLLNLRHGSLKKYKNANLDLYYYILLKRISMCFGLNDAYKHPFKDADYETKFYEDLSRLFWTDAIEAFPNQTFKPVFDELRRIILDTRYLCATPTSKDKKTITDINKGTRLLAVTGSIEHVSLEYFSGSNLMRCDRYGIRPGVQVYSRGTWLNPSKFGFLGKLKNQDEVMSPEEFMKRFKLTELAYFPMKEQKYENCPMTTYDAAVFAILIDLCPNFKLEEVRSIYKSLTSFLREQSALILFDEVCEYLEGPKNREISQLLYTLLAEVHVAIRISPEKLPHSHQLNQMALYLMKLLEE